MWARVGSEQGKILFGEVKEAHKKKCQGKVFSSSRPQLKRGVKCPYMFNLGHVQS